MQSDVVYYRLDADTVVGFEVAEGECYYPAGARETLTHFADHIAPAIDAARRVLEVARKSAPDEVAVKFALKVTGETNWIVAKAATEGSFEVTLTWRSETPEQPL